ncbi:MAG: carbohydrate kinase family protein [Clostridia bacterium]|nr:carbohydrate kinase family protein [Clostridia bacterium]
MKHAIALAGNIVVDSIKYIDQYPGKLELTAIKRVERSLGGAVPNVGMDLARLDPKLPLKAVGFAGADDNGAYALEAMARHPSIDLSDVKRAGLNSFTDVMTVESTGERTFFTFKGADSLITPDTVPLDRLDCDILHVGYALLLDGLDAPDAEYGTGMARVLAGAQALGIRTSLDVVSENSDRYARVVPPALKYADFFSVNEMEAGRTTGVPLAVGGRLIRENLRPALARLKEMGVRRWAVIHTPEVSCGLDERGEYAEAETLRLPEGFIKGSVGAGDAFTAGLLLMAWRGAPLREALETANAVAALSLSEPGATEGVRPLDETMAFAARVKARKAEE